VWEHSRRDACGPNGSSVYQGFGLFSSSLFEAPCTVSLTVAGCSQPTGKGHVYAARTETEKCEKLPPLWCGYVRGEID
jgi:hypothetical protein